MDSKQSRIQLIKLKEDFRRERVDMSCKIFAGLIAEALFDEKKGVETITARAKQLVRDMIADKTSMIGIWESERQDKVRAEINRIKG